MLHSRRPVRTAARAQRLSILDPFFKTATEGRFSAMATVKGGGRTAQAEAVRHGIATAMQGFDLAYRPALKGAGLLKRDSRRSERNKPGRKGARAGWTWVKR